MLRLLPPRARATAVTVGAAAGLALAVAPPASASPVSTPAVSKTTVQPGENFTISGTGCVDPTPGADLPGIAVYSTQLGDGGQAHPDGSWSLSTDFGIGTDPGTYSVVAKCLRGDGTVISVYPPVTMTIPGATTAPPPPAPQTTALPTSVPSSRSTAARIPTRTPPRTTAPTSAITTTAASTAPTPIAPATTDGRSATAPTAAAGCADCAKLSGSAPVRAGEALRLSYTGFLPGEQVTLVLHSTPVTLGTFTADASGVVTMAVTIPASAAAGAHTLILSGPQTGDRAVGFRLAARAQDRPAAAPAAGADLALPLILGGAVLLLLLVIAAAIAVVRLRAARGSGTADPAGQPAVPTPIARPIR